MTENVRISARELLVLTAIIENYIATGEPVASQTLARQISKEGLSSATIRNVMAVLDEQGLLDQPHTSAGRIPTAQAFRIYVEGLGSHANSSVSVQDTSQLWRGKIESAYSGVNTPQQFLERTPGVLAILSSGMGIAVTAGSASQPLEHIHFTRLASTRVLAVVVTARGVVLDRMLSLEREYSPVELETAARFLNENFHGWPMDRIRPELNRRLQQEQNEYEMLLRSARELWSSGELSQPSTDIFIEGIANLLSTELDRERLRQMLGALETKRRLIDLMGAYLESRDARVRVTVGLEDVIPETQNLVLIAAPARHGEENVGAIAVLAPTRIQYQETIRQVSFVAQLSNKIFDAQ